MTNAANLQALLKGHREYSGLSQAEVARRMGVIPSMVSKLESGDTGVTHGAGA